MWAAIVQLITRFSDDARALFTILHDDVETIIVELGSLAIAEARELRRVLFRTVWRLVILWTLGVVTGYLGHVWGVIWLMNAGRIIIALGSLGFAAMLAYLWFRTATFAEVLVILAGAIEKIPLPKLSFPGLKLEREGDKLLVCSTERFSFDWTHVQTGIDQAKAEKLLRQLMSVMAWLAVLGIYASVFPVYTNPLAFLVVLLVAFFIGFATVGWELKSPWSRRAALAFVGFVLLATTINFGQTLLRAKQYNHHLRTQIVYADLYDKYAMAVEGYVEKWGIGIEDKPLPAVRQDPSTRCDQCVDGKGSIICNCALPIPGMMFSSSCTTKECLKSRDELYLNNARLDYLEERARLAKLDAKLRPGTPIEFWNYGMSVMGVGYAKAKAELKELRTEEHSAGATAAIAGADSGSKTVFARCEKRAKTLYAILIILSALMLLVELFILVLKTVKNEGSKALSAAAALVTLLFLIFTVVQYRNADDDCAVFAAKMAVVNDTASAPVPNSDPASAAPTKTASTLIITAVDPVEEPSALSDEKRAKLEAKLAELKALKSRVQAIE